MLPRASIHLMAVAAQVLEEFERLVEEAPQPGGQLIDFAAARPKTPKALAETMVRHAERESRAYVAKLRASVQGLRALPLSNDIWDATTNLMSARIKLLEAAIAKNEAEGKFYLAQPEPQVPLPIMRIITRGLHRVYATQHAEMLDIYYLAMSEVWDRDPESKEAAGSASSADELDVFFQQARGT